MVKVVDEVRRALLKTASGIGGASAVGAIPVSETPVTPNDEEGASVSLSKFGPVGKVSGDDATFSRCFEFLGRTTGGQGSIVLPRRPVYLTRPLVMGKGVSIHGGGKNFSSQLVAAKGFQGSAVVVFQGRGEEGGWTFRSDLNGVCINCSHLDFKGNAISVERAYGVVINNCFVYAAPSVGVSIADCNNITIAHTMIFGRGEAQGGLGVSIKDSNLVSLQCVDLEGFFTGLVLKDGAICSASALYIERCRKGVDVSGARTHLSLHGGVIRTQGKGYQALSLSGGFGMISGTHLDDRAGGDPATIKSPTKWVLSGVFNSSGDPVSQ